MTGRYNEITYNGLVAIVKWASPVFFFVSFCFVYRTNTCMSYRINQLDKIWKVVVLLLYFFFCYLVNIKKKFGNFACFFLLLVSLAGKVNMNSRHGKVYLAALCSFIQAKTDMCPPPPQFELLLLPTPVLISPYLYSKD